MAQARQGKAMLATFRTTHYRFELQALDDLHMPAYQGSTFRGGFGHSLKQLVCFKADWRACTPCARHNDCPYGYIFETTAPLEGPAMHHLHEIPSPFVIEAPSEQQRVYQAGELLGFDLVLVGQADTYLPYLIMAFQDLGRAGVGQPRGRYALRRVLAHHPWRGAEELKYDGADMLLGGNGVGVGWNDVAARAASLPADTLTLRFHTPTRVKYQQTYVVQPAFHVLMRALLRRISSLALFHCGEALAGDIHALLAAAETIETGQSTLHWVDWERFSGRQRQRMTLGGFVGEIRFHGNLAPFRELLTLGTLVHVGKAAVFGHGRYDIAGA
jgi:hypothetical protein